MSQQNLSKGSNQQQETKPAVISENNILNNSFAWQLVIICIAILFSLFIVNKFAIWSKSVSDVKIDLSPVEQLHKTVSNQAQNEVLLNESTNTIAWTDYDKNTTYIIARRK